MKQTLILISLIAGLIGTAKAQFTPIASENNPAPAFNSSYLTENLSFPKNSKAMFTAGPVIDPQVYKKRQRTHLTIGLVLLGTGLLSSGAGLLVGNEYDVSSDNGSAAATLFVIGAVTGIASIPFMSLSLAARNKYKAAIKNQPTSYGLPRHTSRHVTGLTVSIPIGN